MFVKLHESEKSPVLINSSMIIEIRKRERGGCILTIKGFFDVWKERHSTVHEICVEESFEDLEAMLA